MAAAAGYHVLVINWPVLAGLLAALEEFLPQCDRAIETPNGPAGSISSNDELKHWRRSRPSAPVTLRVGSYLRADRLTIREAGFDTGLHADSDSFREDAASLHAPEMSTVPGKSKTLTNLVNKPGQDHSPDF